MYRYNYFKDGKKYSVVPIFRGKVLEIRRGDMTFGGDKRDEARCWNSAEEWAKTVPEDCEIVFEGWDMWKDISTVYRPAKKTEETATAPTENNTLDEKVPPVSNWNEYESYMTKRIKEFISAFPSKEVESRIKNAIRIMQFIYDYGDAFLRKHKRFEDTVVAKCLEFIADPKATDEVREISKKVMDRHSAPVPVPAPANPKENKEAKDTVPAPETSKPVSDSVSKEAPAPAHKQREIRYRHRYYYRNIDKIVANVRKEWNAESSLWQPLALEMWRFVRRSEFTSIFHNNIPERLWMRGLALMMRTEATWSELKREIRLFLQATS